MFRNLGIIISALFGLTSADAQRVTAAACPLNERGTIISGQMVVPPRYAKLVDMYAHAEGVPPELLFGLLYTESEFCMKVVSSTGAFGLGQFMPATAEWLGIDPLDAHGAIGGAARYLGMLYRQVDSGCLQCGTRRAEVLTLKRRPSGGRGLPKTCAGGAATRSA